jgi:hypothetical protein
VSNRLVQAWIDKPTTLNYSDYETSGKAGFQTKKTFGKGSAFSGLPVLSRCAVKVRTEIDHRQCQSQGKKQSDVQRTAREQQGGEDKYSGASHRRWTSHTTLLAGFAAESF